VRENFGKIESFEKTSTGVRMIFSKDGALNSAEAALVTRHIISPSRNVPVSDFDRMTPDSPRISRIGFCNESEAILGNFVTKSSPLAFILGFERGRYRGLS